MAVRDVVGRLDELAHIDRACKRLAQGRSGWLSVVGEPGIGKTCLLAELVDRAESQGALTLTGRGAELERDVPFGVVVDALDDYLGSLEPSRLEWLTADVAGPARAVLPSLGGPEADAAGDDRFRTYRALRSLLERLARTGPVVVVLDDLHWADRASVELVIHLLCRPPAAPHLLALSWRTGEGDAVGRELLTAARDVPGAAIELAPLARRDAMALVGGDVGAAAFTDLYRESGGNPFYLMQLARVADGAAGVPSSVDAAVRAELDRLDPRARMTGQAAAVAGEPFDVSTVVVASGLADHDTRAAIDALVGVGLVRSADAPTRFVFRHPIVRRAVYDSARPGWRGGAHARVAADLNERGAPPASQAHHLALSASVGDLDACERLRAAATEVVGRAPVSASGWLDAALRIVPASPEHDPLRIQLRTLAARASVAVGDLAAARDHTVAALELVPEGSVEWLRLVVTCSAHERGMGDWDAANRRVAAALADAPRDAAAVLADLHLARAVTALYHNDLAEGAEAAELVADLVPGDTVRLVEMLGIAAQISVAADDFDGAAARCDAALDLLREADGPEVTAHPNGLGLVAEAARLIERYEQAVALYDRALATRIGTGGVGPQSLVMTLRGRASCLAAMGRLAEAQAAVLEALDVCVITANTPMHAWVVPVQMRVLVALGELDAAAGAGEEALARRIGSRPMRDEIRRQLALTALHRGDAEACRAGLLAAGGPDFPWLEQSVRCLAYAGMARAELGCGEVGAALIWADRARDWAVTAGLRGSMAIADTCRAELLLVEGRPAAAVSSAEQAVGLADAVGAALDAGRARIVAGEALAACGRRDDAIAMLSAAEAALGAIGARLDRDEAARHLRRLGVRRPGSARSSLATSVLTGREQEIAELVSAGRTNKEIASTVHLSEKTVETHLTRVFAKLGVRRRGAVAAALAHTHRPHLAGHDEP
jgi:DNA-binding CsgD family transcriptional regulator